MFSKIDFSGVIKQTGKVVLLGLAVVGASTVAANVTHKS